MSLLRQCALVFVLLVGLTGTVSAKLANAAALNVMIKVAGGQFMMGDPQSTGFTNKISMSLLASPQKVEVDDFMIAKYMITVFEYKQFVAETHYKSFSEQLGAVPIHMNLAIADRRYTWKTPGFPQSELHPVVCIAFNDALEYCNWRSIKEGYKPCYTLTNGLYILDTKADGYRLPTEAEYEYAARGGGKPMVYTWGDEDPNNIIGKVGNFMDATGMKKMKSTYGWENYDDGAAYTSQVGDYLPNRLGLHDMSGNVWEWCFNFFDSEKAHRVIRGGSFNVFYTSGLESYKVSFRMGLRPDSTRNDVGFRVVRSVIASEK